MMRSRTQYVALATINAGFVGLVLGILWVPLRSFYHVGCLRPVPREVIDAGRQCPTEEMSAKLRSMRFGLTGNCSADQAGAADICAGVYQLADQPDVKLSIRELWEADPYEDPSWRLHVHSWVPVATLLKAYGFSGKASYLHAAEEHITNWMEWAHQISVVDLLRSQNGMVWNDHAVAERAVVLADFWSHYRSARLFDYEIAGTVLGAAAWHAEFLRDPRHYTAFTNHGTMQNLALLHLRVAFPHIVGEQHSELAVDRLKEQFELLITDEGVKTEDSLFYHVVALRNLSLAISYMRLLDKDVPLRWKQRYAQMQDFVAQCRRPDGTLPAVGDTPIGTKIESLTGESEISSAASARKNSEETNLADVFLKRPFSVWPFSGYAVMNGHEFEDWRQTVVTWSHFPGHGHQHANELSVYLYAHGRDWLTGAGYWPYRLDRRERQNAISWSFSNAPYLRGETRKDIRASRLVCYASGRAGSFVEIERALYGQTSIRRQVLWLRPGIWFVLDEIRSDSIAAKVIPWHFSPGLEIAGSSEQMSWRVVDSTRGQTLGMRVLTPDELDSKVFHGSQSPFQGWVWKNDRMVPAPCILLVGYRPNTVVGTLLWFPAGSSFHMNEARLTVSGHAGWTLRIGDNSSGLVVSRKGEQLSVQDKGETCLELDLVRPNCAEQRAAYDVVRERVQKRYRKALIYRRRRSAVKASAVLVGVWLCQEMVLLAFAVTGKWVEMFIICSRTASCLVLICISVVLIWPS